MILDFNEEAQAEAEEAFQYYLALDSDVADSFEHEFRAVLARIRRNPESFPPYRRRYRKAIMRRFPYTVFFELEPGRARVMAVAHQKRRPDYWTHRE